MHLQAANPPSPMLRTHNNETTNFFFLISREDSFKNRRLAFVPVGQESSVIKSQNYHTS